jgi:hypothetical protein
MCLHAEEVAVRGVSGGDGESLVWWARKGVDSGE